jgi:phosphoserine phosphatase
MRLVIQSPFIQPQHLLHITKLCGGSQFTRLSAQAYALPVNFDRHAGPSAEIHAYCGAQQLDCAFVADAHILQNLCLMVMDMDSTLISIECIDEIADMYGLKPQVSKITASAMRGEIEFAESLRRRVALLAGLDESALQRVYDERLRLNPGALELLAACKQHGIRTLLVSGGFTFFTSRLKQMTGLDYTCANTLEIINGKLSGKVLGDIVDAQGKADCFTKARDELGLRVDQTIAIGDGANDLKMMAAAGVSIAYHAKPVVQQQATYALNYSGLDGAINLFTTV